MSNDMLALGCSPYARQPTNPYWAPSVDAFCMLLANTQLMLTLDASKMSDPGDFASSFRPPLHAATVLFQTMAGDLCINA